MPSPAGIVSQPYGLTTGQIGEEQLPVVTFEDTHDQKVLPVRCRERGPVRIVGEGAGLYIAIRADNLQRENIHRRLSVRTVFPVQFLQSLFLTLFPGPEDDGLAVGHEIGFSFLPVPGKSELRLLRPIGLHAPQVGVAIDLAAKHNPLPVGRDRSLRVVPLVVGQAPDTAAVQIRGVKFGALWIVGVIRPVAGRHIVYVIAGGCPEQPLAIRIEPGAGIHAAIINATNILTCIREGIRQRTANFSFTRVLSVRILDLGDKVHAVRGVIGLAVLGKVGDLVHWQLPRV